MRKKGTEKGGKKETREGKQKTKGRERGKLEEGKGRMRGGQAVLIINKSY